VKKYHDTQSVHKWPEDDHIICRNIEPHFMMQYTTNISGDNLKLFYDLYKHNWLSKVKKKKTHKRSKDSSLSHGWGYKPFFFYKPNTLPLPEISEQYQHVKEE